MRIGRYRAYSIESGFFRLDGGAMFGIIPKPLWERRFPADERNRILLGMRCLLLEGEGRLILIDAGIGDKYDEKFQDIYGVDHSKRTLQRSLSEAGFGADEVTDVVLTHLHFDHCGGCTTMNGDRSSVAFKNAAFHVQRRQWDSARSPNVRERGSFLTPNLEPLAASGRLQLLEGEQELFPDVYLHLVEGHTDAQQLVRVGGEERQLLYVADLFPTHAHLPPAWNMAYDLRPLVTIQEKTRLLEVAHQERWMLFFEHDPQVEVASVTATDRGYATENHQHLRE